MSVGPRTEKFNVVNNSELIHNAEFSGHFHSVSNEIQYLDKFEYAELSGTVYLICFRLEIHF